MPVDLVDILQLFGTFAVMAASFFNAASYGFFEACVDDKDDFRLRKLFLQKVEKMADCGKDREKILLFPSFKLKLANRRVRPVIVGGTA